MPRGLINLPKTIQPKPSTIRDQITHPVNGDSRFDADGLHRADKIETILYRIPDRVIEIYVGVLSSRQPVLYLMGINFENVRRVSAAVFPSFALACGFA